MSRIPVLPDEDFIEEIRSGLYSSVDNEFQDIWEKYQGELKSGELKQCMDLSSDLGDLLSKNSLPLYAVIFYRIGFEWADSIGIMTDKALLLNNIGIEYNKIGDRDNALLAHLESISLIKEHGLADSLLAMAYNSTGGVYYNNKDWDNAFQYFFDAYQIWQRLGNRSALAGTLNNIGEIYRIKGEYILALDYYFRALEINKDFQNFRWVVLNCINIAETYRQIGKPDEGLPHLEKSIALSSDLGDDWLITVVELEMGKHFLEGGDLEQALYHYSKGFERANKISNIWEQKDAVEGLYYTYEALGDVNKALYYHKLFKTLNDSLFSVEKERNIQRLGALYSLHKEEQDAIIEGNLDELQERQERFQRTIGQIILVLIVIVLTSGIFIFLSLRTSRRKQKEWKEMEVQAKEASEALAEAELKNSDLEKRRLEGKLSYKRREATTYAMRIAQKNEILRDLQSKFKKLERLPADQLPTEFRQVRMLVESHLQEEEDLQELYEQVELLSEDFFYKLMELNPKLTANDQRLAALIRLDLSSKEIAALNNVSVKAIEMGRYRLRKKLNVESEDHLSDFLARI